MKTMLFRFAPTLAAAPAVVAAAAWFATPSPSPDHAPGSAALPGPGAVVVAAEALVRAIDARDEAHLGRAFAELRRGEGYAVTIGQDGAIEEIDRARRLTAIDVALDGSVRRAGDAADAATMLRDLLPAAADVKTKIVSVLADCPSEGCSWGSIELERTYRDGDRTLVQPLHATMLVRWVGGEHPMMKVFHWHCAATGPARPADKAGKAAK